MSSEEAKAYICEFENNINEETQKLIKEGAVNLKAAAINHYQEAYRNFRDVNHLKGAFLAKLHELRVASAGVDLDNNENLIKEIEKQNSEAFEQNIFEWKKLQ